MKPVDDLKGINIDSVTVALTGDGRWEHPILKALAERYNGNENVLLITVPVGLLGRGYKQAGRFSGLSALQAIKTYVRDFRIKRYLFLIDIEHFSCTEEVQATLEASLRGANFILQHIEPLGEPLGAQAFLVKCSDGSHEIVVHAVIAGEEKCIEEDIARLVSLEYDITIAPIKGLISNVLRQRGKNLFSFVKHAALTNLRQALPDLTAAFESMEAETRHP
jgi:hypothetical protein